MFEGITLTGFADEIDGNLDKQLEVIAKLGIRHIEMRGVNGKGLVEYSLEEVKAIKDKLDAAGVSLSAVGSPIGKINITDEFEPHFQLFCHTVEIAKIMKVPYIRMFSFFIPEGEDPYRYRDEVFKRLDIMCEYAKAHDIILLHENEKDIYGDTAPRCLEILERFYGNHFKAVFDFANFVQCGQDTIEVFDMLKPYVEYVHVKDALWDTKDVVPAGMGDGNVKAILSLLKESGYQGYLSLEPHLADFVGFGALEQDGMIDGKMSGEMAFTTAYEALVKILEEI